MDNQSDDEECPKTLDSFTVGIIGLLDFFIYYIAF
jgi:hypothetical protein